MANDVPHAEMAPALLSAAGRLLDDDVSYAPTGGDPRSLDEHLSAAMRALSRDARRRTADAAEPDADTARQQAVLLELGAVRAALRGGSVTGRVPVTGVSSLLSLLRSFSSLGPMLDRAPEEIRRVGFGRVLLSRVQGGLWVPRSASVEGNPGLADELVRVGRECPGTLNGSLIETEAVRRFKPLLVQDARDNARVHGRMREVIDTHAYVTAPLVVHGAVAGLIHADRDARSPAVDSFDRDLIGLVAEGLGFAVERVVFLERLQALRCRLDEQARTVRDLIDEFVSAEVELPDDAGMASPARKVPPPRGHLASGRGAELQSGLTRRELDVLRRMSLGETNSQIAHRLFVSEGTVKSHVKHILRKLDAANRAEAVSRYHLVMREEAYSPREI